tara:strand:- start:1146 stop:2162 length:1017 start_codon:yes stop_codon:yes gene_type:complete
MFCLWGCSGEEPLPLSPLSGGDEASEDGADLLVMRGGVPGAPPDAVVADAFVVASRYAEVRFGVPGEVEEVTVRIGDSVQRGQVLATLDTASRLERLAETERRYKDAIRTVPSSRRSVQSGPPPAYLQSELRARRQVVEQAARMERSDMRRLRQALVEGGEEGAARMAQSIAVRRNPKPPMTATRKNNKERLARALADDLGQRKRQLEFAIEESTLRCPLAGVVAAVHIASGDAWNTRRVRPAFEILDPNSLVAEAVVPSELVERLQRGDRAWAQLPPAKEGGEATVVEATVESISLRDLSVSLGARVVDVRQVSVGLPRLLPRRLEPGDEVRVALPP